ncbi:MAG: anaerobic sulfite reductase subunit A [Synergistaceae bacterium]|nr:anaerobic sulfite reductase subunit A [Synergistaceae bacterium]
MGYVLSSEGFSKALHELGGSYRLYAPVRKEGEGRFTDVDVVRYDFVHEAGEIELSTKSDYAFKEILTPLSETLFFFTEQSVKDADKDTSPVIIFVRSCDLHAVKRLDQIYLANGKAEDWFYRRIRDSVRFALIGCSESCENGFCVSMKTNRADEGYMFSVDEDGGKFYVDVKDDEAAKIFAAHAESSQPVTARYVTENDTDVNVPENVPNSIYKSDIWDEYTQRCINCGRCNFVCPTCTCYTMQDVYYTDNGRVGERRRVGASCMVDGYTNVAGGGQYRKTNGERMRFKVLHKVWDFRRRFGYDMCVGCGRCDDVCPEYISFANCVNKLDAAIKEAGNDE